MFSLDPQAPESETVLISAVWGLGKYAVDGTISPDLFTVSRDPQRPLKHRRVADKPVALTCRPEGGVAEVTLSREQAQAACLTDDQARTLADILRDSAPAIPARIRLIRAADSAIVTGLRSPKSRRSR
jgi:pyruvate,water dikinase